jgi:ribonuclease HI
MIPQGSKVLPQTRTGQPRAAIYSSLDIKEIGQLAHRDMAVGLTKIGGKQTMIISLYLDITQPALQDFLIKALEYGQAKRYSILIGADTNSHSKIWGNETNKRGQELEEMIEKYHISVHNVGKTPTYDCKLGKSIIDVTMSVNLRVKLENWRVSTAMNHSDHNTIKYDIKTEVIKLPETLNYKKGDWEKFRKDMEQFELYIPEEISERKLDKMVDKLTRKIQGTIDKVCPKIKAKVVDKNNPWWTPELKQLRKEVKVSLKKHQLNKGYESYEKTYKYKLRTYKKKINEETKRYWNHKQATIGSEEGMAKHVKRLTREVQPQVGTLEKDDGTFTAIGEETSNEMLGIHYPSNTIEKETIYDNENKCKTYELGKSYEWINNELIMRALLKFKDKKSPGPDEIRPLIFKHLPKNIIDQIRIIYKACVKLNYTPTMWKDAKVIFIPKPGKENYKKAKSFRPITLSNYLLKGLEKLIVWKVEENLECDPIHKNQHGFQRGKSTETAISKTVTYIEKFVRKNEPCIAVFLDIQAAFDTINIDYIKLKLEEKGIEKDISQWYYNFISHRNIITDITGYRDKRTISTGFPQGGVCSAKFWIIVFDEALQIINSHTLHGHGFADDLCVMKGGQDMHYTKRKLQKALDRLHSWGTSCGLSFSPQKTIAVNFGKQVKGMKLKLGDQEIKFEDQVRYLGIYLDKKLDFKYHIDKILSYNHNYNRMLTAKTNSLYGPRPKLMKWAYTGITRVRISYAAMVWVPYLKLKRQKQALKKINRTATLSITNCMRSTPQSTLEILYDIEPLELHLQRIGLESYCRLRKQLLMDLSLHSKEKNHLGHWENMYNTLNINKEDRCEEIIRERITRINLDSFDGEKKHSQKSEYTIYTDGSKLSEGVGAGYIIYYRNERIQENYHKLKNECSVFQAELEAIYQACKFMNNNEAITAKYVKILSDSQAAILALYNERIRSNQVLKTLEELEMMAANTHKTTLAWTKAHAGTEGNEEADRLAKEGAMMSKVDTNVDTSWTNIKHTIRQFINLKWEVQWMSLEGHKHSKQFVSKPDPQRAKKCLSLSRHSLKKVVHAISGHNYLAKHQAIMEKELAGECRLCGEDLETFMHLLYDCPAVELQVRNTLQDKYIAKDNWEPKTILEICRIPEIEEMMNNEVEQRLKQIIYIDLNYSISEED